MFLELSVHVQVVIVHIGLFLDQVGEGHTSGYYSDTSLAVVLDLSLRGTSRNGMYFEKILI